MLLVYAFASGLAEVELGLGLDDAPLSIVDAGGGICAIIAHAAAAPAVEAVNAIAFDAVMKRLFAASRAMLPARFGSVVRDREELESAIEEARDPLERALALGAERAQMTLRLSGRATFSAPIEESRPASGGEYLARKLEQHRRARSIPELDAVKRAIDPLLVAERSERHDAPPWFASAYHLIDRRRIDDYVSVLAAAIPRLFAEGITVRASGPHPPYAFAPGVLS